MPIQQMLLGAGTAVAKKTYLDDIFSSFVYVGSGANRSINNGIDLSGEGGMVWIKIRNGTYHHFLFDTVRGAGNRLYSNRDNEEYTHTNTLTSFNNNGFSLGNNSSVNESPSEFTSYSFKKAPGFFDCIEYVGNGTAGRTLSHSLDCVPGMILIKQTNSTQDWVVYHRSLDTNKKLKLNGDDGEASTSSWNSLRPTSTTITLGAATGVNATSHEFVAYIFAGGASTSSLARSVEFDGSNDRLDVAASTDFNLGTNDFTIEYWLKTTETLDTGILSISNSSQNSNISWMTYMTGGKMQFYWSTNGSSWAGVAQTTNTVNDGQWHHVAMTRTGGNIRIYLDGVLDETESIGSSSISSSTLDLGIGHIDQTTWFDGKLSNVRIVNGTAVYTSSFKPPTEPLTNITNTKLLCCNDSSTTGKTVGPTITANGPTASTDSPFDDPAGFKFGENEDQNAIACGSYIGTGSNPGPEIILNGEWEPEFILVKRTDSNSDWYMFDATRGIINNSYRDHILKPNENDAETQVYTMRVQGSGFLYRGTYADVNADGGKYIYMAIRSATGSVKRPPSLGTDVFAMALGTGSSTIPTFVSSFRTDFAFYTSATSNGDKIWTTRNSGSDYILSDTDAVSSSSSNFTEWDSMTGWATNLSSSNRSYMWKRHKGLDCLHYFGTGSITAQVHNLGQSPEMMFIKRLDGSTQDWIVYHKALASNVVLQLNESYTYPATDTTSFNQTAPSSTHFTIGTNDGTNADGSEYRAHLFASVDEICKVDSFDGSNSDLTVTVGFQPRFLMVKAIGSGDWVVVDTARGWGSGNDKIMHLNSDSSISDADVGAPTSTGFTLTGNNADWNQSGTSYIYYAHA